jgi:Domain of unknown function (DUF4394)
MTHLRLTTLTAVAALLAVGVAPVSAATLVALQDGKSLVSIDTDKKLVTSTVAVADGASLVGLDVRPSDGRLYGVTPAGDIVTIDAKTGKWEKKSTLSEKLPANATITIDFNPVADRMRILTSTGTSLRVNVDDGKATVDGALKYAETDPNKGKTPNVQAGGYSNSCAGAKETALYDIDMASMSLMKQAPPNDGILTTIGALGTKVDGPLAFDVWTDCKGQSVGWLLHSGSLSTVDLASGKLTPVGAIKGISGKISDIAIMP